jgi:hypothetical protein
MLILSLTSTAALETARKPNAVIQAVNSGKVVAPPAARQLVAW